MENINTTLQDLVTGKERIELEVDTNINQDDIELKDYFNSMKDDLKAFDERAWKKGDGYRTPRFPMISDKLEGIEAGLYLFPAESNAGKSALMMNVIEDLVMHKPNKLFGLYFSLDDSKHEIIPRVIAMRESIPISVVSKPHRYQKMIEEGHGESATISEQLLKREEGIKKLSDDSNKMMMIDGSEARTLDQIKSYIDKVYNYVKSLDPEMNLAIAIDSIKDIELDDHYGIKVSNDVSDKVAVEVKQWTVEMDLVIMSSVHLRKLNGNRRPTLDDLKDSNKLVYEASCIWLLFNDVSKNKQAAKLFYQEDGATEKKPVIELDWAKNKKSSYKGRSFCYFSPEHSKASECGEDASKRFNALIYEA